MNRTHRIGLSLSVAALLLAGCQAQPVAVTHSDDVVALGGVGPGWTEQPAFDGGFRLGAGDALGREIFAFYVASLRGEEFYATGESPYPQEN